MITDTQPLVSASGLTKIYGGQAGFFGRSHGGFKAVDDVTFSVGAGEILGLVGESGSGKSTVGRMVLRLEPITAGNLHVAGRDITKASRQEMRPMRKDIQAVFQDPYASLSPRMRVGRFVAEALEVHGLGGTREQRDRVEVLFKKVGLDPAFMERYPHELSGGQRQRICIARAIASDPKFIVADEPITALDVSIQAQIVNLFRELQKEMGLAYLFIAHDLSMVRYLCDRVAVMLNGRIVEMGPTSAVFANPLHDYTRALISAMPIPDPDIEASRTHLSFDRSNWTGEGTLVEQQPRHFILT